VRSDSAPADLYGVAVIDILDPFSTTKAKTVRTLSSSLVSSGPDLRFGSALSQSTAAVTSVTFIAEAGTANLKAGSRLSIYGVKG